MLPQQKKRPVLIVDDQKNWRDMLAELLDDEFEITTVDNCSDAISAIENASSPFYVVITDQRLVDTDPKNEDGLRLADIVNQMAGQTKTIIVTGYATVEQSDEAHSQYGVFRYLQKGTAKDKSFDPENFRKIVRDAANKAEEERKAKDRTKTRPTKNREEVFVVMPFKPKKLYDKVFECIRHEVEKHGYSCRRADNFSLPRPIMKDVFEHIEKSKFIVADLSDQRPNVFFEVGIAHAMGKSVIFLTHDREESIPSYLRPVRLIPYKKDSPDLSKISDSIQALEEGNFPSFFENKGPYQSDFTSCLVFIPQGPDEKKLFSRVIEPTVTEQEISLQCRLVHDIFGTNEILDGIWEQLNVAQLVISDLSNRDPSIFYLSGIAHGINPRKVIYLSKNEKDIPFDLQGIPRVIYSLDGVPAITETMKKLDLAIKSTVQSQEHKLEKNKQIQISNLNDKKKKLTADVLLVTATDTETHNLLRLVRETLNHEPNLIAEEDINTYWDLGKIKSAKVMLVQSGMGPDGPGGATLTIADGIKDLSRPHVIMLGIAFGVDPNKQRIGDVLVSKQILDYELQRVGTSSKGKEVRLVRGNRTEASPKLVNRFRAGAQTWNQAHVHFGLILSGAKLIDNIKFRQQLCSLEPEAIGGEMEGASLYSVAEREKVDWILVKAICDWADGNKEANRHENQTLAASNAASFVLHVLQQGGFKKTNS